MKFLPILYAAGLAVAAPAPPTDDVALESRQWGYNSYSGTVNDLQNGRSSNCPKVIFICARGSGESGNMGSSVCPLVARGLARYYPNQIWVQGVGGGYRADLGSNALPGGTSSAAIAEATEMFTMAAQKCPQAAIATGGYSQGSAVVAGAVKSLPDAIKNQIKGAVLYGYTQNKQNRGTIPNFPTDKTKVFCATGDMVCNGVLTVTSAHFSYISNGDASTKGPAFLHEKIGDI